METDIALKKKNPDPDWAHQNSAKNHRKNQGWGSDIFFHRSGSVSGSAEKKSGSGSDSGSVLKSKWRKK